MQSLQTMQQLHTLGMDQGLSSTRAASNAERATIKEFTSERRNLFNNASYHMSRFIRNKDRSSVMKTIHALGDVLDANAEQVNGILSSFAAGMTQNTFVWATKNQSSLTVMVKAGEKSGMSGEAGFADEFRGFSEDSLKTYLMTQTKQDWFRRASNVVMAQVSAILEQLALQPGTRQEACGLTNKAPKQYGTLAYKSIWKGVGSIASKAAYFEEYVRYEEVVNSDCTSGMVLMTDRLERMQQQLHRADTNPTAMAGDSYAQDLQDEIVEYMAKLDIWEAAHDIWNEKLGGLVAEWNEIQVEISTDDDPIQLPTGDIDAMHQWMNKASTIHMASVVESIEVVEFNNRLKANADQRNAALVALFA